MAECELVGLSSATEVHFKEMMKKFSKRAKHHPHGWGIGVYHHSKSKIYLDAEPFEMLTYMREAQAMNESSYAKHLIKKGFSGDIAIAHIRKASQGDIAVRNTHPFERKLGEDTWVFAHNGDLKDIHSYLSTNHYTLDGETDSELAFCYMMDRLHEYDGSRGGLGLDDRVDIIGEAAYQISTFGNFNFLLSDGQRLYAHRSTNLSYYTKGTYSVVASHPFGIRKSRWSLLPQKEVVVFEKGKLV